MVSKTHYYFQYHITNVETVFLLWKKSNSRFLEIFTFQDSGEPKIIII